MEKSPDGGDYRQRACYTESARSKTVKVYFMTSQSNKFVFLVSPHYYKRGEIGTSTKAAKEVGMLCLAEQIIT